MDARVKEIEARCEKARSQAEKIFGVDPLPSTEAAIGAAGLLDIAKKEWGDEWSIYDESVRAGLTAFIAADIDIPYLLTALRESEEREKSQQRANEMNHEEYQDLCAEFALPKACGCNSNGNDQWCALAPFHEIKRLREREKKLVEAQRWIPVSERLPECDTTPNSFGVPVLVWPPFKSDGCSDMTQAFYGCRQTDEPNFYIFGRVFDPEYWMPLPAPPAKEESHD